MNNPLLMKSCSQYLWKPLAVVINCALGTGIFPGLFKYSKVVPVFKNGDSRVLGKYMSIVILPAILSI